MFRSRCRLQWPWLALFAAALALSLALACGSVRDTAAIVGAGGSSGEGAADGGLESVNGQANRVARHRARDRHARDLGIARHVAAQGNSDPRGGCHGRRVGVGHVGDRMLRRSAT